MASKPPLAALMFLVSLFLFVPFVVGELTSAAYETKGMLKAIEKGNKQAYCKPTGPMHDSCCDFETVENVNRRLAPILGDLVTTTFFRYWKVNLNKECPFWLENPLCILEDCSVIEADEREIPEEWKMTALSEVKRNNLDNGFSLMSKKCEFQDKDFCIVEDEASSEGAYINLLANGERFTGYAGPSAKRIWDAIYRENCFDVPETHMGGELLDGLSTKLSNTRKEAANMCIEERVFYRLISGLHASISTHICEEWMDRKTGQWGRNLTCFVDRVGNHIERVQNLYFTYGLLLRAVTKLEPFLRDHSLHSFCTGRAEDTQRIEELVDQVADKVMAAPSTFDEKALFADAASHGLLEEFKNHFRNISQIMDCVACEKCKLWGKLQISGLGTALKILFSCGDDPREYRLTRGEVVALFNALTRLSESITAIDGFRVMYQEKLDADAAAAAVSKQEQKDPTVVTEAKPLPESTAAVPTSPEVQLPPLPLMDVMDVLTLSEAKNPWFFIPFGVGFAVLVFGVLKTTKAGWDYAHGRLKVPDKTPREEAWEEEGVE
ncbi:hypothetical protein HK104_004661, partial [Borealophlyctis nickersoniae]